MSKGGRHSGGPASAAGAAVRVQREGEGHVPPARSIKIEDTNTTGAPAGGNTSKRKRRDRRERGGEDHLRWENHWGSHHKEDCRTRSCPNGEPGPNAMDFGTTVQTGSSVSCRVYAAVSY